MEGAGVVANEGNNPAVVGAVVAAEDNSTPVAAGKADQD